MYVYKCLLQQKENGTHPSFNFYAWIIQGSKI